MPYFEQGNIKYFYYERFPEERSALINTILFVHGAGGSGSYWTRQLTELGGRFRVLAVDLPGHGKSGGTACDSIAAYREFVKKFAEKTIVGPFYLCGHSLGGAVALDLTLARPELLQGLILMSTGAKLRILPAIIDIIKGGRHYQKLAELVYSKKALRRMVELGAQEMAATKPLVWFKDLTACDRFDITARLAEIRLPVLILTGTDDLLTPVKYGRALAAGLPDARLYEIEGAGHMPMLEKTGEINQRIVEFIEKG
ncbi:MAG: 2-hydroxy-6-oxo-6-phenylhexa-2,4-dienoate hydrolase [Pelotomaculum sp. PtaB.Bin104]|nr:MAG: 2-hydroxy-6-oxo-6-phenylhexa-2,4-dienoate hydrolase [Pelotomaculum sp. PtaB.Bin104]